MRFTRGFDTGLILGGMFGFTMAVLLWGVAGWYGVLPLTASMPTETRRADGYDNDPEIRMIQKMLVNMETREREKTHPFIPASGD